MFYVYILQSGKDGGYYTGQTRDVEERLRYHNAGYVRSTRFFRPWSLVGFYSFPTRKGAVNFERHIKSFKGGQGFKNLLKECGTNTGD